MESLTKIMRDVSLFKDLSDDEIKPFIEVTRQQTFADKSLIFMHDMPMTDVFIIASGKVKVFRNDVVGKEQIICVKQSGDLFPQVGFFRKENYPAHAQTIEETVLYSISISDFENVIVNNPNLSIKLFRVLGDRIVSMQQRLEELPFEARTNGFYFFCSDWVKPMGIYNPMVGGFYDSTLIFHFPCKAK